MTLRPAYCRQIQTKFLNYFWRCSRCIRIDAIEKNLAIPAARLVNVPVLILKYVDSKNRLSRCNRSCKGKETLAVIDSNFSKITSEFLALSALPPA